MSTPVFARISYSVAEAAEATGLSEDSIRQAIASGDLVAHYAGRRSSKPLIRAVELDSWVAALPTSRGGRE